MTVLRECLESPLVKVAAPNLCSFLPGQTEGGTPGTTKLVLRVTMLHGRLPQERWWHLSILPIGNAGIILRYNR
jgi:hypothetical protein